jgi:hypothetical protein
MRCCGVVVICVVGLLVVLLAVFSHHDVFVSVAAS